MSGYYPWHEEPLVVEINRLRARLSEVEAELIGLPEAARFERNRADGLAARLAEVEAERDHYRQTANVATKNLGDWEEMEARLAKAERERDEWHACARRNFDRLAEVEAVLRGYGDAGTVGALADQVRAAARGEGDRPAEVTIAHNQEGDR